MQLQIVKQKSRNITVIDIQRG